MAKKKTELRKDLEKRKDQDAKKFLKVLDLLEKNCEYGLESVAIIAGSAEESSLICVGTPEITIKSLVSALMAEPTFRKILKDALVIMDATDIYLAADVQEADLITGMFDRLTNLNVTDEDQQ